VTVVALQVRVQLEQQNARPAGLGRMRGGPREGAMSGTLQLGILDFDSRLPAALLWAALCLQKQLRAF
jgi:hypothetical protein